MSETARESDVAQARTDIIKRVGVAKAELIGLIEGGDRDWPKVHAALSKYIDYQTAADVLGGMTKLEQSRT